MASDLFLDPLDDAFRERDLVFLCLESGRIGVSHICPGKFCGFAVAVDANHSHICDFRVGQEDTFELCWWHLESLTDVSYTSRNNRDRRTYFVFDKLFSTIYDPVKAICVARSDVPCFEPPVLSDTVVRSFDIVEISL